MRYKWIELYNYAGIYNGMGLTQIKIDFTRCTTNKVIIRGNNGSGKSTLMDAINPNPDSNDKFIPGVEARKNICLCDNGIDYVIRYIHPVTNSGRGTTKGYISKMMDGNLVELNPNGNISSCRDILYSEFNLDSNYLSLSQLTSENRGLVDSKPAERKKLINSIISSLETYNAIHKNLTKKSSTYKSLVNSLTAKIDYIGNPVALNAKLQNIENRLITLEQEKNATIEAIAAVKIKISDFLAILRDNNYDDIVKEIKALEVEIRSTKATLEKKMQANNISDVTKLRNHLTEISNAITSLEAGITLLKGKIPLLAQRETEFKELQNKQEKLNSLQSDYNYLDIKAAMESAKSIVRTHEEVFSRMGLLNINLITQSEFDTAMEAIEYLRTSANALTSSYDLSLISKVVNDRNNVLAMIRMVPEKKRDLEEYKELRSKLEKDFAVYQSKRQIADELRNRPENCSIDTCPYIKSAVEADREFPLQRMLTISEEIAKYSDEIENTARFLDEASWLSEILTYVNAIERELDSKIKFIMKLPIRRDFKETFMQRVVNLDPFSDIDALYKFVDCGNMIEEYKVAKEQLKTYEMEYRLYESKNEIIETIISDIQSLTEKTNALASEIDKNNTEVQIAAQKLLDLKKTKDEIESMLSIVENTYIPAQMKQQELISTKNSLDGYTSELNRLQDELSKLNTNMAAVNNDSKALTDERDAIKHSLILLSDYQRELKEYSEKYTKIEKIRYYSSSSTGIQTIFMSLYMNNIIRTANDLLSLLFDGEFALQPFVINESEFRIPCLGSGLLHDDISSMSTAQKSMISMILSFSILNQSATRYNIIRLDELDGGLDTSNRGYFITLLDQLMGMLQCEQAFIISHNNELDSSAADIIVLKNTSHETYTGNIIWKY